MRLAISNLAWDPKEDLLVAKILGKFGVDAIDIAPGKYFPDPASTSNANVNRVRRWWADQGIEITGMQALLFGTNGLNLFDGNHNQNLMLDHLRSVCRIGANLGATRLVFGSPKNRDRLSLTDAEVLERSINFFRRLGKIAHENGVIVCLEPNPASYGANFMTTSDETALIVNAVAHSAIRMQFDTGAIKVNKEDAGWVLSRFAGLIGHIHASEPNLLPLGDSGMDHCLIHKELMKYLPNHIVSIEMLATKEESQLQTITRSLTYATECYRSTHRASK